MKLAFVVPTIPRVLDHDSYLNRGFERCLDKSYILMHGREYHTHQQTVMLG